MKRYLPPSIHNLVEIRECYTRSYQLKAMGVMHRMERQFNRSRDLQKILHIELSQVICDLIEVRLQESTKWHVTRSTENPDDFQATDQENILWQMKTDDPGP
jgi:hypothetical protein